jgi:hypothetical protein
MRVRAALSQINDDRWYLRNRFMPRLCAVLRVRRRTSVLMRVLTDYCSFRARLLRGGRRTLRGDPPRGVWRLPLCVWRLFLRSCLGETAALVFCGKVARSCAALRAVFFVAVVESAEIRRARVSAMFCVVVRVRLSIACVCDDVGVVRFAVRWVALCVVALCVCVAWISF